jgi:glutathione peroxidase
MTTLESIAVKTIDGAPSSLGAFAGQVRLVVNVASKCGLTPPVRGPRSALQEVPRTRL